jgi:isoleucyl-tRNA synthetase
VGDFELSPEDVMVSRSDREGYSSASEAGYTAAVDTEITPELKAEGTARELVHILQNMRRSADFDIADHIVSCYRGPAEIEDVVQAHGEYIRQETLSDELVNGSAGEDALVETHKVNGLETVLGVVRSD